ncbi:MAG TPA: isochorismatase family protein [Granulicella sp.]|nr:isochorismatase family protein [Granulicella sp.]
MASLHLVPETTALVVIDLQKGIVGRALEPHTGAEVVQHAVQVAKALRAQGGLVVWVRVALGEILPLPTDIQLRDPNAPPPPAEASELIAELERQPEDVVITKRQWGAFYGTELEQRLRRHGVRTILMAGISTNFGVESTARQAQDMGYELVFVEDAMTSMKTEMHRFSTETIFPRMGRVRSTETVLEALKG